MIINHINLIVQDVASAIQFFETYFDFKCTEVKGDSIIAILEGADGFSLVLMKNKTGLPVYPEGFHLGFFLKSKEEVHEIFQKLKEGGHIEGQEPKKIRDSFGFYFNYENIMMEIGYYVD